MAGAHNLSKDFFELIKDIGESKSKQEEDKIIQREMEVLKGSMPAPNVNWKKMKEFLVRLLYVEMLGHDGSFGYIHAVNLTSSRVMMEKRTGYLAVSLMLHQDHDLILLLIANIQRDMASSNYLEVSAALTAVMKLVNADTAPAILDNLMPLFQHPNELIRKKAVMATHAFHMKSPSSVIHLDTNIRKMLCDKDPGVMGASLHILYDMMKNEPEAFKDLVPSYVSILRQIVDHRLPKDYDYHRMPAPWIQIKLLQNLAVAGTDDAQLSETMYDILHDVMKRADMGINVGYAVMYECVRTVTSIYPNVALLDAAATSISRFITSDNHNLKYLGIKSLAAIVQINSKYAAEHQMIVVDCLDDSDETLKRKTLDLLYKMTTPGNVVFIAGKLMDSLEGSNDPFLREELVSRITELAERFAPDNRWFIQTMNAVFDVGGDLVKPEIAHNLMRLIAEGSGGVDEAADTELRLYAVREYSKALARPKTPELFLQLVCWVLGEYSYIAEEELAPSELVSRLCDVAERPFEDLSTRCYIVSALSKIVAQTGIQSDDVKEIATKYISSKQLELQQRCYELMELLDDTNLMSEVLPMDASTEDLEADEDLSFLDDFVEEAISAGARRYDSSMADMSPRDREIARDKANTKKNPGLLDGMKLDAYDKPEQNNMIADSTNMYGEPEVSLQHQEEHNDYDNNSGNNGESLNMSQGGRKQQPMWGPGGLNTLTPTEAKPKPVHKKGWEANDEAAKAAETLDLPTNNSRNTSSSFTPPADSNPYESAEDKKKKEVANQLFGGMGTAEPEPEAPSKKSSKKEKKEKKSKKDKKEKKSKKSKKEAVSDEDTPEEVEAPAPSRKSKKERNSSPPPVVVEPVDDFEDLLGFGGPAPAPVARQPAPVQQVQPVDDLMDLLGDSMPATTQQSAAPSQGLLQPLSGSAGSGSMPVNLPPSLNQHVGGALPWQYQKLASDSSLEVHCGKLLLEEHMCLLISAVNVSGNPINGPTIQLSPPKNFQTQCMCDPHGDIGNNRVAFQQLPPHQTAHVLVGMQMSELMPSMAMRVQISYMADGANKSLSLQLPINIADLLRPVPFSTDDFREAWEGLGDGHNIQVGPTTVKTTAEFMKRIGQDLHLHPIQAIGSECICAGQLAGADAFCLIHADVGAGSIDITCNSQMPALTEMLSRCCATQFK